MISAVEALKRLQEGNRRFVDGVRHIEAPASPEKRKDLLAGQAPFAVILACSDSRVPVEHIFDQGFGDLFVIRVAGNIVTPSLAGSAEYAVQQLGTRLLVVLGHTRCGAVGATLESLRQPGGKLSENIASIVDRIRPAVEDLLKTEPECDPDALLRQAVRANVRRSVDALRQDSEILRQLMDRDGLRIVGAEYSLESGEVDFFDDAPA
ncbi:MAG: carbonic anhydrase [Bacteroidetes bacterium SB0662_bin_6]|nr:carbonic anhydrase [Bacteroidetes bacterium SB0668_bin_1]MYE03678.1 carbonic anhydrase [Bacteroidetes bacterium SB0662_bin_6]